VPKETVAFSARGVPAGDRGKIRRHPPEPTWAKRDLGLDLQFTFLGASFQPALGWM